MVKITEHRLVLPMTTPQYNVAQLYMVAKASMQDSAGGEGVEILKNEPFDNGVEKGQFTHKRMFIGGKLPSWAQSMLPAKWLTVDEKAWNAFPHCKTMFTCGMFPKFALTVESMHADGSNLYDNIHKLEADKLADRKVELIDIAFDPIDKKDYKEEEDPQKYHSEKTGLGPLTDKNWWQSTAPTMTCYKLCTVEFKYWGLQSKVESMVQKILRDVFFKYHRKAFCWMDEWFGMTIADIRQMEAEAKAKLDAVWQQTREAELANGGTPPPSAPVDDVETPLATPSTPAPAAHTPTPSHGMNMEESKSAETPTVQPLVIVSPKLDEQSRQSSRQRVNSFTNGKSPNVSSSSLKPKAVAPVPSRRTGTLYKLGDGPINFNWNSRYFLLDGSTLFYYRDSKDHKARGIIPLQDALVKDSKAVKDRLHSFSVFVPTSNRTYFFSAESEEETASWREAVQRATKAEVEEAEVEEGEWSPSVAAEPEDMPEQTTPAYIRRASGGVVPNEMSPVVDQLRTAVKVSTDATSGRVWRLRSIENGIRVSVEEDAQVKLGMAKVSGSKGLQGWISTLILLVLIVLLSVGCARLLHLQPLWVGVLAGTLGFLVLSRRGAKSRNGQLVAAKSCCVVDASAKEVFECLMDVDTRYEWDPVCQAAQVLDRNDSHSDVVFMALSVSAFLSSMPWLAWVKPRELCVNRYWRLEETGTYVVAHRSTEHTSCTNKSSQSIRMYAEEGFVIKPLEGETHRCVVTYVSKALFGGRIPRCIQQQLQILRVSSVAGIREHILLRDAQYDADAQTVGAVDGSDVDLVSPLSHALAASNSSSALEPMIESTAVPSPKRHSSLAVGQRKPLSVRLPGLLRLDGGGLKCVDKEQLNRQKGVVYDLIRTAGKALLEGKNAVSISLPVRIFEPRSTLERICDWWAYGPVFLNKAADLPADQFIERFKYVMCFAVSGLHLGCHQLKPFNPILGETFQATWPDGAQIFVEHTSHHPPISNFQVEGRNRRYNFWGYYEYVASLKGNAVVGRQEGPNHVQFPDGQSITFSLPDMKISGLMWGDRVIEWTGALQFEDKAHNLSAKLVICPDGKAVFGRSKTPCDFLRGEILLNGQVTSQVQGSWLEGLDFDGKRYWDLELYEPSKPLPVGEPLPSDCRFREDLIHLAQADLDGAQEWKLKLEVLQRADRKMRQDTAKAREKSQKKAAKT